MCVIMKWKGFFYRSVIILGLDSWIEIEGGKFVDLEWFWGKS